jgi:hypothetical protein
VQNEGNCSGYNHCDSSHISDERFSVRSALHDGF